MITLFFKGLTSFGLIFFNFTIAKFLDYKSLGYIIVGISLINGLKYSILSDSWDLSKNTDVNYISVFKKN